MSDTEKKNNTKKRKLNKWRFFIFALLLAIFIIGGAGIGFMAGVINNMPYFSLDSDPALSAFVYDNEGKVITQLRGAENRIWADLDEIPEYVKNAFIAIEDIRFYDHFGVDIMSVARALYINLISGETVQGASTITMQLARNAFIGNFERVWDRKIQESIIAVQLERKYTKDEILELYLNHINFGEGAWGIRTAAQVFFDKELDELTLAESAFLAGVVQRPSALSPFRNLDAATNRRNLVLYTMAANGFITREQEAAARQEEFVLNENRFQNQENHAWFVDFVIQEASDILRELGMETAQIFSGGLHIYTTMDTRIQTRLEELYTNPANFPPAAADGVLVQSAAVLLDHYSGEILALVGGRGEITTRRGFNRASDMQRQPGSAIKPITAFGPALELGRTPATVYDDAPVEFRVGGPVFSPHNHDRRWRGLMTMRQALTISANIPALLALYDIGTDAGFEFAKRLGLPLVDADNVLSLALGGFTHGISPLDLATAYGAFANQGVLVESHAIRKIVDRNGEIIYQANPTRTVVMTEQTAFLMTDMLVSAVTGPGATGRNAAMGGRPVAGKTGTTQLPDIPEFRNLRLAFRDSWFAGYSPEFTAVVWMGFDETTPRHYLREVFGGGMPARLWRNIMQEALRDKPVRQFPRPGGIVHRSVDAKSGLLPSSLTPSQYIISEVFASNHVPTEVSTAWVRVRICADTGSLASDNCPNASYSVRLQRPVPFTPVASRPGVFPADFGLEAPINVCHIHGGGTGTAGPPGTRIVFLCGDDRHGDNLVLARIPQSGQGGGCSSEVIIEKRMYIEDIPREYCNIRSHQLYTVEGAEPLPSDGNGAGTTRPPTSETTGSENETDDNISSENNADNENNAGNIDNEVSLTLSATLITDGDNKGVLLSWNSLGSGVTYTIQRRGGGRQIQIGSTARTSFLDENIEAGQNYIYQIVVDDVVSNTITINVR